MTAPPHREDIEQAAALDVLERIHAGDPAELVQLAHRAANAALIREYRREHDPRTTPDTIQTEDGDEIHPADLDRAQTAPRRPERAAEAADLVRHIIALMPSAYRADAPQVLAWTAAGYTAREIAAQTGSSSRRVERILKAARDAARSERSMEE